MMGFRDDLPGGHGEQRRFAMRWVMLAALSWMWATPAAGQESVSPRFVDLSLSIAPDLPSTWPEKWPLFQINHYLRIGRLSAYNSDILTIDPNTGTQMDVPPHSIPRPDSGLPNAGPFGAMFSEKVPAWQFGGEACVIDCRDLRDSGADGQSPLVGKQRIMAWEKAYRPLGPGDVVLLWSGYSDKYYKPLPAGRRFIAEPVEGKTPAWPDPEPECMEYLASRGVRMVGTDSPSMGPIPDLAEPTHIAGLRHGMIFTEGVTGLDKLPTTGAFYCMIGPKHAGGAGSEVRSFAVVGNPLAEQLIQSARTKQAIDLSVVLSTDLPVSWPGAGVGNHREPYFTVSFAYNSLLDSYGQTHILDSHAGTHLVPPSYALPRAGFDNESYSPRVQNWLAEYERKYGPRGTSDATAEKVPISQTCGRARVVDVKHLRGTTDETNWPASPEITPAVIERFERQHGPLKPGDVVIFHSGHSDQFTKPGPEGDRCMADPLNGKREGWPAPGPDAIRYLAGKGIRCVATDGPTLGGAQPRRALMTYWALGGKGMVGVEYLTNVGKLPQNAFFLFATPKIINCHGGPGRAIALY